MKRSRTKYPPDVWAAVEHDYRFTTKPEIAIAREYGMHRNSIRTMAKRRGWMRGIDPYLLQTRGYEPRMAFVSHAIIQEAEKVDKIRNFLVSNLGCTQKEVIFATGLSPRTVSKAIKILRAKV